MSEAAAKKTRPAGKKTKKGVTISPDKTVAVTSTPAEEIIPESIADLRPAGYNPRTISVEQQEMLRNSMKEYGDIGGIVFNVKTGRLVGGHQRIKQLDPSWVIVKTPCTDETGTVALGYIETPHGRFNYREVSWTEAKEKAANIAANKMGGIFDDEMLAALLKDLQDTGYDMALTGFEDDELKALLGEEGTEELGEEDPDVEPVPDPFVKLGDLWLCGESRLLCGDSTSMTDLEKLMMGDKADLVVTDPPYGVAYSNKAGKIENDDLDPAALEQFLQAVFGLMGHALKPGGAFYIYHADGGLLGTAFRNALTAIDQLMLKQVLIWVKHAATLCRSDYNMQHEPCLYGWKAGAAHFYDGDFTRTSVIDDDIDISKMDKKALQNIINELRTKIPSSVMRVDKPAKSELHPTQKPVRLFERNVQASSQRGQIVLDFFNGSGTILITCRKTGRRGRGMELSPQYAQASLQRYWEYCKEEPLLLLADGSTIPFSEVEKQRSKK